jgi:type II secretory pathway component PulF
MAIFEYKAVGPQGQVAEGSLEANGRQDALRILSGQGLKPVRVAEAASAPTEEGGLLSFSLQRKRVSARDLERFTRQLSSLLSAGVPLSRALQILTRESSNPAAAAQWKEVRDLVVDGMSLADAMAKTPEVFPRVYVAMVRAGEMGGFLDLVLAQVAEFQATEKELKSKITSAMIYPAVLMVLAIAVLVFLLVFFIPRFQLIFQGFGAALPLLTRVIIAASDLLSSYGLIVLIAIIIGIYGVRSWLATPDGRRHWQRWLLKMPVVGPLAARFAMTRFCRMLGTLTHSGVELIASLRVARESIGNQTLIDAINDAIERVRKGDSLSSSLSGCPQLFPGSVVEMISVAEESGRLDEELVRLAQTTEKDLDGQLRTAVALAEPLLLFLMAAFIGTIFVGMVIPIFTIQDYIN